MTDETADRNPLDRLADEFVKRYRAGERPALTDYCDRHPELAGQIRELFPAIVAMEQLKPGSWQHPDSDNTRERAPEALPGQSIGPYKLLEQIGEGGMGEVWVADQLAPIKRRVALKLIKPGMDSRSVLGRFEAERQALAVMDHPNIAKVLDAGTTSDGRPFFVMELVKGTPITEFCDTRKLTPKQRLELFIPVCLAIQHAHMKGIIHRDIKPSNVLVALHDETPVPKVIDFGVAKAIGQQLSEKTIYTGFGALVGTPAYMAPEQATFNQLDVDTRADVYALGVLLYELLAGSPPIEKERLKKAALDEVLRIVREEEPPRPSQRLSTSDTKASIAATRQSDPAKLSQMMKGEIDWIVMKALEKDRTRRYDTANGLAKDIQRYLLGDAVEACPPTLRYRFLKTYRRNRAAILTAGTFAVVLLIAAGVSIGFGFLAKSAERVAEDRRIESDVARGEAIDERDAKDKALRAKEKALIEEQLAKQKEESAKELAKEEAERANHLVSNNYLFLAQAAWKDHNPDQALSWLESTPAARRGWVWQALRRQFEASRFTLHGHAARIHTATYSKDGTRIATASGDHTARIWDAATGKELLILRGHKDMVTQVVWHPAGTFVATLAIDSTCRVWNAITGEVVHEMKERGSGIQFSPDGSRLAGTFGGRTAVMEVNQWSKPTIIPGIFGGFSPNGSRLLTGVLEKQKSVLKVWDTTTGEEKGSLGSGMRNGLFSPDGSRILTHEVKHLNVAATIDPATKQPRPLVEITLRFWDATSFEQTWQFVVAGDNNFSYAISPSGSHLATLHQGALKLWTIADGRLVWNASPRSNEGTITFRPDGAELVTCGGKTAQIWDVRTGKPKHSYQAIDGMGEVRYSPDGKSLLTFGDKIARVWDSRTNSFGHTCYGNGSQITQVALSPEGRLAAAGAVGTDPNVEGFVKKYTRLLVWDTTTGRCLAVLNNKETWAINLSFSPDGRHLIATHHGDEKAKEDSEIAVWDVKTWQIVRRITKGKSGDASGVVYDPTGRSVAISYTIEPQYEKNWIEILDAKTWETRHRLTGSGHMIQSCTYSTDGSKFIAPARDVVSVFEAETGKLLREFRAPKGDGYYSATFDRSGRRLAFGSTQHATVWDLETGRPLLEVSGNTGGDHLMVSTVAFAPDDRTLVTASSRWPPHHANFWDLRTGQLLFSLPTDYRLHLEDCKFTNDGTKLVIAAEEGDLSIFDITPPLRERVIPGQIDYLGGDVSNMVRTRPTGDGRVIILGPVEGYRRISASADGEHFALALADNTVRIYSSHTGTEKFRLAGHTSQVHNVLYDPTGKHLATVAKEFTVRLWNPLTGEATHELTGHTSDVVQIAFSRDGKKIVTSSTDKTVRVWDVVTGQLILLIESKTEGHPNGEFSADGAFVAARFNQAVEVWDLKTKKMIPPAEANKVFGGYRPPPPPVAPEGRYYPVRREAGGKSWIVIVDRELTPEEHAKRVALSEPDLFWHAKEWAKAKDAKDSFAERFHGQRLGLLRPMKCPWRF